MSTRKTGPGPVVVELACEANPSTDVQEIDRADWDAMTPGQRLAMLEDMTIDHMNNAGGCGWNIADPDDEAAVADTVPDDVDLPADPGQAAALLDKLTSGLTVSVDVSTGDHDAGARVYARISGAQEDSTSGGPMLLAEIEHDNRQSDPLRDLAEWLAEQREVLPPTEQATMRDIVLADAINRARRALGKEG